MARKPTLLNDLPDLILLKILSYVGPEDICLNIGKVCKWWNVLAEDMILWKKLSYHCDRSSAMSHIAEVLTVAPALHSVIVCEREDAADILKCLFQNRRDLRKLILKCCYLGQDSTGLLANIVALYPDLEVLSLQGCHPLTSTGYHLIPHLKKLSELNLSYCKGLSGKTVRRIADSCQHLKKLNLGGVKLIVAGDVIHVINGLAKQLTTLVLDGSTFAEVAFLYLNNCCGLQELEISSCWNMTDRGLLEGIGSLQKLTSLCLDNGCSLTAQALSTFLHGPSMTSIVSLNLSFCADLDDEGLKGIAERCKHLKELALPWCWNVTDAGISTVISHCNQLHVLNLTGLPKITGEGWLTLLPSHLPRLRQLYLMDCGKVRDEYVEEVKAALPDMYFCK